MIRGKTTERPRSARDTYLELVLRFPLRPIRNARELDEAIQIIDSLLDRENLDRGESDYLDVLSDLVARYESKEEKLGNPTDSEMLAHLLEASGKTQAEAARQAGIASSTFSEVLSGKRKLTRGHIQSLSAVFHVPPAVFYP